MEEETFKKLLVPSHIPYEQLDHYLAKLEEKKEYDLHKQNLNVQNT